MSSEVNLPVISKLFENFGSGNIDGILELLTDDVIWVDPGFVGNLYKGRRLGKAEAAKFFYSLNEVLNVTGFDVHELIPNGNCVIALGYVKGNARNTGKEFSSDWVMVFELNNRKVSYHHLYIDTNNIAESIK